MTPTLVALVGMGVSVVGVAVGVFGIVRGRRPAPDDGRANGWGTGTVTRCPMCQTLGVPCTEHAGP